jgi:hypothetical protein
MMSLKITANLAEITIRLCRTILLMSRFGHWKRLRCMVTVVSVPSEKLQLEHGAVFCQVLFYLRCNFIPASTSERLEERGLVNTTIGLGRHAVE